MPKKTTQERTSTILVLRTCREDMTSRNGFKWPDVGGVAEAPDWIENNECGNGLHGWLYGQGDYSTSDYLDESAKWLVVEVEESSIIMFGGKCKFPRGVVRFVGDKKDATDYLVDNEPRAAGVAVIGATVVVGDRESAVTGYSGTATAGALGTATAGYSGTIAIRYWDNKAERYRLKVGDIGENGLEPNTAYRLDKNANFVKA